MREDVELKTTAAFKDPTPKAPIPKPVISNNGSIVVCASMFQVSLMYVYAVWVSPFRRWPWARKVASSTDLRGLRLRFCGGSGDLPCTSLSGTGLECCSTGCEQPGRETGGDLWETHARDPEPKGADAEPDRPKLPSRGGLLGLAGGTGRCSAATQTLGG